MKRARRKSQRPKVWLMPEALQIFIHGQEDSLRQGDRALRLLGELQRLSYADYAVGEGLMTEEIRDQIRSAWIERLLTQFPLSDTTLFADLAEAHKRFHIREPKTAKQCLAESYLVLANPVGHFCAWRSEDVDRFLARRGGQINTWTVRLYAEILWKNSRRPIDGVLPLQMELRMEIGGTLPETRWSRLFEELGLTKEFLPRFRGGRPSKEVKSKNIRRPKKRRIHSQS
jgi:hypothetical protein